MLKSISTYYYNSTMSWQQLPSSWGLFILLLITLTVSIDSAAAKEPSPEVKNTLGPKACTRCHKESARVWKHSKHYKTYKEIPRKRIAKKRAKKMRFKQIKSNSLCVNCHFTAVQSGSRTKTVAGISCESCHGASKNWIGIHSDFGGRGVKANEETPEHKIQRHFQSESKGMIQLSNTYELAKNCYRCHTVPEEKLVNIGRHPAGSDFELIQWGQGENRHNLWHTEDTNNVLPQPRLRIMYVVGKALDLEYALRGLAKATVDGGYFQHMTERARNALSALNQISLLINSTEVKSIIELVNTLKITINNPNYETIANKVGELNRIFSIMTDATKLQPLDTLLPTPDNYKGKVYQP